MLTSLTWRRLTRLMLMWRIEKTFPFLCGVLTSASICARKSCGRGCLRPGKCAGRMLNVSQGKWVDALESVSLVCVGLSTYLDPGFSATKLPLNCCWNWTVIIKLSLDI